MAPVAPPTSANTGPTSHAASPPPLTPEQLAAIQVAHGRSARIRRAATVATLDAALMALFTAFCLLSALVDPVAGILLGLAFAAVTFNSFRGAAGLRRLDPAAPRLLAWNQLFLAASVIVYAGYSLTVAMRGSPEMARHYQEIAALDPEIGRLLQDTSRLVYQVLYLGLIGGTVVAQGLTGWYYASRGKLMRAYLAETPGWVVQLQKTQGK